MAVLGLRFCARAFPSCGERGPLFIAVRGPLTIAASPAAEHRLQTRRPSSCGSRAQLLRGMWDPPRPGLEPVSPCIGRQTLNHCATREAQKPSILRFAVILSNGKNENTLQAKCESAVSITATERCTTISETLNVKKRCNENL